MFVGVLAIGLVGAVVARFRPEGMARALFATALDQELVAVIALTAGVGSATDILGLTVSFAGLWLLSAGLFRNAAQSAVTQP